MQIKTAKCVHVCELKLQFHDNFGIYCFHSVVDRAHPMATRGGEIANNNKNLKTIEFKLLMS